MKTEKLFKPLRDIFIMFLFGAAVFMPKTLSDQTREGIVFCLSSLVPSLFCANVIAKCFISTDIFKKISDIIGIRAAFCILGMICGTPFCAQTVYTMYKSGRVDKKYAEYICSFTTGASLPFLIGFVGEGLFGDMGFGIRLALYQLAAMVIDSFATKFLFFRKINPPKKLFIAETGLTKALAESAKAMAAICASALFFISCGGMLIKIFGINGETAGILRSFLEFSSGCKYAFAGECAKTKVAFTVGHGGLAAFMQLFAVTEGRLDMHPAAFGKIIQCGLITLLAVVFG